MNQSNGGSIPLGHPLRTSDSREEERPRGAVRSARHAVNVEIAGSNPVEGAFAARYANRQSGQAQTLVIVGSTPTCATCQMRRLGIGEPQWP